MSPLDFLALLLTLTATAAVWQRAASRKQRAGLMELAREWGMHYSPGDRFNLAASIAPRLPMPGASNVRVSNLLYGLEQGHYRYVFLVEYSLGVVRSKHRYACVAAFREPRAKTETTTSELKVAPSDLPLIEQYKSLQDVVLSPG